jgi:hypothetical protein
LLVAMIGFAHPGAARADASLRLGVFADPGGSAPPAHLVPALSLGGGAPDLGSGGSTGGGNNPVLALVLGIFPGFGLGHYVAGAAWQTWALIDVLILVAAIVITSVDAGILVPLAWVAIVVERVIEGLDAYHEAGGGKVAARAPGIDDAVRLRATDRGAPAEAGPGRAPELVLARF